MNDRQNRAIMLTTTPIHERSLQTIFNLFNYFKSTVFVHINILSLLLMYITDITNIIIFDIYL